MCEMDPRKFLWLNLLFNFLLFSIPKALMADTNPLPESSSSKPGGYIIYTKNPPEGEEPESYHLRTLTSVLGSEDAAKESLLYTYTHAACGFSAKLTPEQVSQMSKQPNVLQVMQSKVVQLM